MLRFRPNFGAPPGLVREVTLIGVTQQGAAFARALHHGRAADCAAIGQQACLTQVLDPTVASQLTRLEAGERVLAGRDLRRQRRGVRTTWSAVIKGERAAAAKRLADLGVRLRAVAACVPFQLTLRADAIDAVHVSGCNATLLGLVWSPFAPDECDRGWKPLHGPICLPVEGVPAYGCTREAGDARSIAKRRIPEEADLPPNAPRRTALEVRLLGPDFDELHHSLEQALGAGGQFFARLASDDPDDGTTWRYDVVRDALTAAADPYFARVLGLYWVHTLANKTERFDYKLEAEWPVDGDKRVFCWVVFDRGMEAQPALPAPTEITGTSVPGSAHMTPDGVLNPCEMDVTVNWRRPSVCEMTDPVLSPIAYLVERTDAGAPDTGPYRSRDAARVREGRRARGRAGDDRGSDRRAVSIRGRVLRGPRAWVRRVLLPCARPRFVRAHEHAVFLRGGFGEGRSGARAAAQPGRRTLRSGRFRSYRQRRARLGESRRRAQRATASGGCDSLDLAGEPAAAVPGPRRVPPLLPWWVAQSRPGPHHVGGRGRDGRIHRRHRHSASRARLPITTGRYRSRRAAQRRRGVSDPDCGDCGRPADVPRGRQPCGAAARRTVCVPSRSRHVTDGDADRARSVSCLQVVRAACALGRLPARPCHSVAAVAGFGRRHSARSLASRTHQHRCGCVARAGAARRRRALALPAAAAWPHACADTRAPACRRHLWHRLGGRSIKRGTDRAARRDSGDPPRDANGAAARLSAGQLRDARRL